MRRLYWFVENVSIAAVKRVLPINEVPKVYDKLLR